MNIAFNINKLALVGLGVTLNSLLKNCSDPKKINIYILCADLNADDKENIQKLLYRYGVTNAKLIDFNAKQVFGSFSSLQGDLTNYGRLLLQDYIKDDMVLYLDADLVVELDVLSVEGFDFEGKALAAVNAGELRYALDYSFLNKEIGMDLDTPVFNSGIMLFNLKLWREKDVKNQCLTFGQKYSTQLTSHDQTILNALFAGNFAYLPDEFNLPWFANNNRPVSKKAILHFVGSPKPWDLFGRFFHKGFSVWKSYLDKTWEKAYYNYHYNEFVRAWHIRRSYARTLMLKMKSKV